MACKNSNNRAELYPVSNFHSVSYFHAHFVSSFTHSLLHPPHPLPPTWAAPLVTAHNPAPDHQKHTKVGRRVASLRRSKRSEGRLKRRTRSSSSSDGGSRRKKEEKLHLTSLRGLLLRTHHHSTSLCVLWRHWFGRLPSPAHSPVRAAQRVGRQEVGCWKCQRLTTKKKPNFGSEKNIRIFKKSVTSKKSLFL